MPGYSVLAAALTDHSARTKRLTLGGVDVVKKPGMAGNDFGVSLDSVTVTENGPSGVSEMSFTIDDPKLEVSIADGMEVQFHDLTRDYPIFYGWVQGWSVRPDFGTIGRSYTVRAVGTESVLDWAMILTDTTFPAGQTLRDAVQEAAGLAYGTGPLRAISSNGVNSSQAFPIAGTSNAVTLINPVTVSAGTTLREAIRQLSAQTIGAAGYGYSQAATWVATVDFYYGLRLYADDPLGAVTTDFTSFVASDLAILNPTENLDYALDGANVRAVVVKGTGVTLIVSDGSGLLGPVAKLDDANITTSAQALAAGIAYLTQYATIVRGNFTWTSVVVVTWNTSAAQIRPGSKVTLIDTPTGLSTDRKITAITKTFYGTDENWTFAFGGLPPSMSRMVRQLTRTQLS